LGSRTFAGRQTSVGGSDENTIALSISAGVLVGADAVQALHAQTKAPAYVIAEIDVMNPAPYDREYVPPAAKERRMKLVS
jgi:hypothetical protein